VKIQKEFKYSTFCFSWSRQSTQFRYPCLLGVYLFKYEKFRFARHFTSRHIGLENFRGVPADFHTRVKKIINQFSLIWLTLLRLFVIL